VEHAARHLPLLRNAAGKHCHNARDLDLAVRWGFGWDAGPFENLAGSGLQAGCRWINADIAAARRWPGAAASLGDGGWNVQACIRAGSYSPSRKTIQPRSTLPVYRRQLFPDRVLGETAQYGETVFENDDLRMWHSGDAIAILSFKTKMHAVSNEVLDGILRAVAEAEANFKALILWQTEPAVFCGRASAATDAGRQEVSSQPGGMFDKLKGQRSASSSPSRAAVASARFSMPPRQCARVKRWWPSFSRCRCA